MEESHHLLRPLLSPSTTTTTASSAAATPPLDNHVADDLKTISANSSILLRLSLVAFIGIVSIWANHEASKGYDITIVNESADTFLGKRFNLFYVSNDEAVRLVIRASQVVENFLYPHHDDSHIKKPVSHIVVKLADRNSTDNIIVESSGTDHKFVLNISPWVMEGTNFGQVVFQAVQRGVARVWLWDGRGNAPESLVHGIVEYMMENLGVTRPLSGHDGAEPPRSAATCWKHEDSRVVAEFLGYCERRRPGLIRRLNQAMMDGWDDRKLDGLLGQPAQNVCTNYESLRYNISSV